MRRLAATLAALVAAGCASAPQDGGVFGDAVPGPYAVVLEAAFGSPKHIVYRPASLAAFPDEDTLPVVIWANGGCVADGRLYSGFLSTLASHGFLVVTSAPTGRAPQVFDVGAPDLIAGVDWAEAEAARAGSALFGKIDTGAVAVMGQSCGGFLTVLAAGDPRVDTIGMWNSGVGRRTAPVRLADLYAIHSPALYVNGDRTDQLYRGAIADFNVIRRTPVLFAARRGAGHGGTFADSGGGEFANVGAAWLRWRLKGDLAAGAMFQGEDCGLCTDPNWEVRRKRLEDVDRPSPP
jgi:hypothetical protein